MAFAQNQNYTSDILDLPDTQEILTEDESQSMFSEPLCMPTIWAKLHYIPYKNFSLGKYLETLS